MKWQDIYDIVEKLEDKFPQENILQIRYTDLHKMIIELDGFNDAFFIKIFTISGTTVIPK